MNGELVRALAAGGGVVRRSDVRLPAHVFDYAVRAGQLVSVHRGCYVAAGMEATHEIRGRAALAHLGESAVLSHTSALAIWRLVDSVDGLPVHVTVPPAVRRRGGPGLVVHRRAHVTGVVRHGLPVTRLEASVVDSWPLLPAANRRAPVIEAVGGRHTTAGRLRARVAQLPRLPGRHDLLRLLDLLEAGCHSPLEIWGLEHVFTGPELPRFERQVRMRLGARSVYLDVYAPAERVNFELDGAAVHSSPIDRERDLRRDAALAARGILVVRFTCQRLVSDPVGVRREVLQILSTRHAAA